MKNKLKQLLASVLVIATIVGCTTTQPVTRPDGTVVTNPDGTPQMQHVPDPHLVGAGTTIEQIAPTIPPPYGWAASAIGGLILAGGTIVANYKNKKKANQWEDVATTIIQGVESVTGAAAEVVKKSVEARSLSDGNHDLVRDAVAAETKGQG